MSSTTLLRTLQTGHVGLNVTDLNRSIDFYRAVLGLQLTHEGTDPERRYAMLGRDGRLVSGSDFSAPRLRNEVDVLVAQVPRNLFGGYGRPVAHEASFLLISLLYYTISGSELQFTSAN